MRLTNVKSVSQLNVCRTLIIRSDQDLSESFNAMPHYDQGSFGSIIFRALNNRGAQIEVYIEIDFSKRYVISCDGEMVSFLPSKQEARVRFPVVAFVFIFWCSAELRICFWHM